MRRKTQILTNVANYIYIWSQILLQFTLKEKSVLNFASYASEFAESLEESLLQDDHFSDVNAVIVGAGKTKCGIS